MYRKTKTNLRRETSVKAWALGGDLLQLNLWLTLTLAHSALQALE